MLSPGTIFHPERPSTTPRPRRTPAIQFSSRRRPPASKQRPTAGSNGSRWCRNGKVAPLNAEFLMAAAKLPMHDSPRTLPQAAASGRDPHQRYQWRVLRLAILRAARIGAHSTRKAGPMPIKGLRPALAVLAASAPMAFALPAPGPAAHLSQPSGATDYTIVTILGLVVAGAVAVGALASLVTRSRRRREPTRPPRPIERREHRNEHDASP
jgi:hypothetical protein